MTSTLAQLHHNVEDRGPAPGRSLDRLKVSEQKVPVELLLHGTKTREEDRLVLGREGRLDVGLETAEHEGSQDLMQLQNELLFFIDVVNV
jgi:hypothetical protein